MLDHQKNVGRLLWVALFGLTVSVLAVLAPSLLTEQMQADVLYGPVATDTDISSTCATKNESAATDVERIWLWEPNCLVLELIVPNIVYVENADGVNRQVFGLSDCVPVDPEQVMVVGPTLSTCSIEYDVETGLQVGLLLMIAMVLWVGYRPTKILYQ